MENSIQVVHYSLITVLYCLCSVPRWYPAGSLLLQRPAELHELRGGRLGDRARDHTRYKPLQYCSSAALLCCAGFDDQGRQFDADGNLVDWWEEETERRYRARAQCVVDQFSSYTFPQLGNLTVNGVTTQVCCSLVGWLAGLVGWYLMW